jgi:transcriptional regulator with XRE-family HTH domain
MPWPQLDNFKNRLAEYQASTGKTQDEVAHDLGTTYGTLRFWLAGTRQPSLPTLQAASKLFKCSVTEFLDDPGRIYAGQDLSDQSEEDRFFASLIIKTTQAKDLSSEQRQWIIEDVFRAVDRVRALGTRGSGRPALDFPRPKSDQDTDSEGGDPGRPPRKGR